MGFDSLFDKIEPTGFGLNSMALPRTVGTRVGSFQKKEKFDTPTKSSQRNKKHWFV